DRILVIAQALRAGISQQEVVGITQYDPWFVEQISEIIELENNVKENGIPTNKEDLFALKRDQHSLCWSFFSY
ncbi:MAG: hypothetical protein JKX75_01535, partial [Gammaproteobacteria bacterium]|nr:hypothetical protein [Gammaproteobacteria bacterium]